MNPLEQVTKCQNYIMFTQLNQYKSKITSQSKTSQTGRISELEGEKLSKNPLCAAPISPCIAPLWGWVWGTSSSPNWAQGYLLESPTYIISNPSRISKFGYHLPLQNCNIPRLLLVCENRGREVIFRVFLTSWGLKTCPNFLAKHQTSLFSMNNPKL